MLFILDRDGVINHDSDAYIKSPEEWIAYPGSLTAIKQLNDAGNTVVVATNQSGVGRGYYDLATLEKIHAKMHAALATVGAHVDGVYFCPHAPNDGCTCRKPRPGLLHQIQKKYPDDFDHACMIGDSMSDLNAAVAANITPILVKTGKGTRTLKHPDRPENVAVFDHLADAVANLLAAYVTKK